MIKSETTAALLAEDEALDAGEISDILHTLEKMWFVAASCAVSHASTVAKKT